MDHITEQTLRHIATLAQLELAPDDAARLATQLGRIVEFVEQLQTVPSAAQTPSAAEQTIPLRDDVAQVSPTSTGILDNAPAREGRFFLVPQVIA